MTLDEAIKHCEEKEEHHRRQLAEWEATSGTNHYEDEIIGRCIKNNRQCAEEHRQLAEWLKELKEWRSGKR